MLDSIFVISNALVCPPNLSIYSVEERYEQTLATIDSIDRHCSNNMKIMFDASSTIPDDKFLKGISEKNVTILYTGQDETINFLSKNGMKSPSEAISFMMTLNWIKRNDIKAKRIYKISGRYTLTDSFVLGSDQSEKIVFTVPTKTWMTPERIQQTGVDHVYQSRLFHFDYSFLDQFIESLALVIDDCINLGIDIEHGYYKHFHKYNPAELPVIGLRGNLAPNGELIND